LGAIATISSAQSVTTAPVGAVSVNVPANTDIRYGAELLRAAVYSGQVSSVNTSTITVSGTIGSLGTATKFVKFTSGSLAGQWFTLVSSTSSTLSVAENLVSLGAQASDKFEVRPFWTLSSLLPSGGGIPASADVFSPTAYVLLNNPSATGINLAPSGAYFYHDGSSGLLSAGWYIDDGSFNSADDVIVNPDVSLVYRNGTSSASKVLIVGDVPASKIATTVVARVGGDQDNIIYNPYPKAITLAASGLDTSNAVRSSADIFSPGDQVLVYSNATTGLNAAPSDVYFYHDGSSGFLTAGWYKNDGSFADANTSVIPAGGAFIVRKVGGSASSIEWTPNLPYTL